MLMKFHSSDEIGPNSCCFSHYRRKIIKNVIDSYFVTDVRCSKPAVVLITQQSRRICVDPNLNWVKDIMKSIDDSSF
uniref:C-C motif chemokine n=1 Tax=Acanthochromis polyacanthus TaxID=80966 RepID=A0A3Q1GM95_9TELE